MKYTYLNIYIKKDQWMHYDKTFFLIETVL